MKAMAILLQIVGAIVLLTGASGAENGASDAMWISCTILGLILMLAGRFVFLWHEKIEKERRIRRCRRYM